MNLPAIISEDKALTVVLPHREGTGIVIKQGRNVVVLSDNEVSLLLDALGVDE